MNKRVDIEILRILSAFGIVWFHAGIYGSNIAYSGLIFFIILSLYTSGHKELKIKESIKLRFPRLIIPWMVWSGLFGLLNLLTGKDFLYQDSNRLGQYLAGTSIHLWYLPYIFISLVFVDFLRRQIKSNYLATSAATIALILLICTPYSREVSLKIGYPWSQYFHGLPAVFLGIFFLNSQSIKKSLFYLLSAAIALAALFQIQFSGVGIPYFIGAAAGYLIASRSNSTKKIYSATSISSCTFGIYLVHPFIIKILAYTTNLNGPIFVVMVFLISYIAIVPIKKINSKLSKTYSVV